MNTINMNVINYIRFAFLMGAISDGLVIIPMLIPEIASVIFGSNVSNTTQMSQVAMGVASSLMAGWTLLLIWGAIKPLERRIILPLTTFVIIGIATTNIYGISYQVFNIDKMIYLLIHLAFLCVLFVSAFFIAEKHVHRDSPTQEAPVPSHRNAQTIWRNTFNVRLAIFHKFYLLNICCSANKPIIKKRL